MSVSVAYVSLALLCRREMRVARHPNDSKVDSTPAGVAQGRARRAPRQRAQSAQTASSRPSERTSGALGAFRASARARRHPRPMWALKRGLAEPRPQLFQAAVRRLAHGGQPSLPMACDAWLCSRRAETE
eukprot:CAMPEP_0113249198 /NCGR_PEP_ID=MMETSP0008_2-20120614/10928_1 /TAXON_ID=97485 /ORGANISM="Prymnesium parvum" /LENGTH=129 /DNA_ID=CAMNT_0000097109 /DNA_START=2077 /DNA_END=2464 /DNA_ORIENTATION=+ /assembly_acc=CAM_ASM_000153